MLVNLLLLAVGLAGLTLAADRFVLGAAQVAARLRVSTVVTGALIIGFGTSAPELVVSTLATLTEGAEGTALAVGNIVGSNFANLTLVLSIPVLALGPIAIERGVKRQAALSATGVTILAALVWAQWVTRLWGLALLVLTLAALKVVLWLGDRFGGVPPPDIQEGAAPWVWTALGLTGTMGFAWLAVWSATGIAEDLGWTGGFVGFALVALGTSLPELVTVLAAARRNESGLIVGNLLGSNLFNSLLVGAAVFLANGSRTLDEEAGVGLWVVAVLVAVSWLVIPAMWSGRQISRGESGILLSCYVTVLVLMAATGATA